MQPARRIIASDASSDVQVLIGLGGNQGDVPAAFERATVALAQVGRVLARSSLWRSAAQGPAQPDFCNAAVRLGSDAPPLALLAFCSQLEAQAGRTRDGDRWGPRPLDLDLLLVPDLVIAAPSLVLPHPRLATRRFALLPAAELAPGWVHPRLHRTLADLAADPALAGQRCERLGPFPSSG
jgi:2-amino-4-hydroxy-6-hydroxymethyldihydropteridine diphosphokinase